MSLVHHVNTRTEDFVVRRRYIRVTVIDEVMDRGPRGYRKGYGTKTSCLTNRSWFENVVPVEEIVWRGRHVTPIDVGSRLLKGKKHRLTKTTLKRYFSKKVSGYFQDLPYKGRSRRSYHGVVERPRLTRH